MRRNIPLVIMGIVSASLVMAFVIKIRPEHAEYVPSVTPNGTILPEPTSPTQEERGGLSALLGRDTPTPSPTPTLPPLPSSHLIPGRLHVFQTFNNCGPASLSMLLSYHGVDVSQAELGEILRPYQIPGGDNDDKSVILAELAAEASKRGFSAYHRPSGTVDLLKKFVANDMPVLVRTWLKPNEDIGHYRLIRGYDDATEEFIQDDSLQGKNLRYSYNLLLSLWQAFSYEYVVIVPQGKEDIAKAILGDDLDETVAWQRAKVRIQKELSEDPQNIYSLFNMSVASYHLGEYEQSVSYFEQAEAKLPFRMLWYQIEPVEAYFKLKRYDKVLEISEKILNNHNRAFSELYYLRGLIYKEKRDSDAARNEFELAVRYNKNFAPAKAELAALQ